MLSNANVICAILSTCLQYADHADRASLPIGVKGRRKEKKKRKEKKRAVLRAAAAFGRQLKTFIDAFVALATFLQNNPYD